MWAAFLAEDGILDWRRDGRIEVRTDEFTIQNLVGHHVAPLVNCPWQPTCLGFFHLDGKVRACIGVSFHETLHHSLAHFPVSFPFSSCMSHDPALRWSSSEEIRGDQRRSSGWLRHKPITKRLSIRARSCRSLP